MMASLSAIFKRPSTLLFMAVLSTISHAQQAPGTLREGHHMLTLHWTLDQTSRYGSAMIERASEPGVYTIKGEHRAPNGKSFLTIDGTLKPTSPRELTFIGDIKTMDSDNNNGQVCDRNGTYHFKASGSRKYWRLQEMLNCDQREVDYVDIYFE
jgi:hypothetical protein